MKQITTLNLNEQTDMFIDVHSSCMIDKLFMDKFCRKDEKKADEAKDDAGEAHPHRGSEPGIEMGGGLKQPLLEGEERQGASEAFKQVLLGRVQQLTLKEEELAMRSPSIRKKPRIKASEGDSEMRVEIKAVELDDIFVGESSRMWMKALTETENIDIFSLKVIQAIIFFQWKYFKRMIIWKVFVPFIAYFLLFIVYGSLMLRNKASETEWGPWSTGTLVFSILVLIMAVYMAYIEVEQLKFHKWDYFSSFWNLVDLVSLVLNVVTMICDLVQLPSQDVATLAAIAVLFMWLKTFYFLRIFSSTASLVRMIIEITSDMKYFLVVLMMAVLAFTNAFYILTVNLAELDSKVPYSFVFSYRMGLGDFNTDDFGSSKDELLLWILWFANTLIINIILLNLLIAIMGDTFDRVLETTEGSMLKEITAMMQENEFLFNRERAWRRGKYIIIV